VGAQENDRGRAPLARVARLCALPIGVLAWRAPEPTLTVVVKATFLLGLDGTATLAAAQEPLSVDRPAPGGSHGDLARACDFIPLKARVDLLLTGHARAEAATHVLPVGFAIDKRSRHVYATPSAPSVATPLLSDYLRSSTGEATRVGPRALWAGPIDGAAIVGDDGVPCAPIPRGFDYAAFNVAPPEQQIELLSLTALIVLDGLTPEGRRSARLPGIRPRVFVLPDSGSTALRPPDEIVLRCDTLWIDADRGLCVLTWRGVVPLAPNALGPPSLVLALDEGDRKKTWARAFAALEGAAWTAATEPDDVRDAPALAADDSDDDDGPTTDRMERRAADSAPPPAPIAAAPLMVLGGLRSALASFEPPRPRATTELPFLSPPASPTLPFLSPRASPTLPFVQAARPPAALPFTAPLAPPRPLARMHTLLAAPRPADAPAALPFAPIAPPPPPPAPAPPPPPPPPAPAPPLGSWQLAPAPARTVGEAILFAADPAPPSPTLAPPPPAPPEDVAPPGLSLAQYAEIKAEIWGDRASVAAVLQLRDLDEAAFLAHERRLAEGLAREATEGRSTLARGLRDALGLARDRRASTGERPLKTLEQAYITLLVALDRAVDPSAILAAKGMSPAEWRRLRRRFEERAGADAKLRDALAARLAAARAAAVPDTGSSSTWWNRRETTPARATRVPAKPKVPG
jgi:hypothetical protein